MTLKQLSAFILRSKSANLNIFIDTNDSEDSSILKNFLSVLIKHCERWSQLRYDHCSPYEEQGYIHPALLDCMTRTLHLPRLTSLSYNKYDLEGNEGNMEHGDYLVNWQMPRLLRFNGRNTFAEAEFKNIGNNLTFCSLNFDDTFGEGGRDFRGCLKALESFPLLRTLVWKLSDTRECANVHPSHKTRLRHLHSFQIELKGNTVSAPFLKYMFAAMEMPILSSMTVIIRESSGHASFLAPMILDAAFRCANLRTFVMDVPSITFDGNFLVRLAAGRPSLNDVTLRGRGLCTRYPKSCHISPSWRSLRLEGFSREDQEGITGLIELIASGPHNEGFRLYIAECVVEHHFIAKLRCLLGNKLVHEN